MHLLCVPLLCAFVLGVWCAGAALAYIVRTSFVDVVESTTSTRRRGPGGPAGPSRGPH